jgi:predicted ATPase
VGKSLLKAASKDDLGHKVFDIVNSMNIGMDLLEPDEKIELATLNNKAGTIAQNSNAHKGALEYFQTAIALLGDNRWDDNYALTLELHNKALLSSFMSSSFALVEKFADEVLNNAKSNLDKMSTYEAQILLLLAKNHPKQGTLKAVETLKTLNVIIPTDIKELLEGSKKLRDEISEHIDNSDKVFDFPMIDDPEVIAAMGIFAVSVSIIYYARPDQCDFLIRAMINLTLKYGIYYVSGYIFIALAVSIAGDYDLNTANKLRLVGEKLIKQFDSSVLEARLMRPVACHITNVTGHLREELKYTIKAVQKCLDVGDLDYGGLNAADVARLLFLAGYPLEYTLEAELPYVKMMTNFKMEFHTYYINICLFIKDD